jgi:methylated-DNA-[protein]-cysteine S-methyltransferase
MTKTIEVWWSAVETPLGSIVVAASGGAACAAAFGEDAAAIRRVLERRLGPVALARGGEADGIAARVVRYFAGDAAALDGVAVDPGGTAFQREVWDALRSIPAGEARSYAAIAATLGRPGAARAVGAACGRNPVALVVPCHRAVGAGGALTGYAWGLERKRWLLEHERAAVARVA